MNNATQSKRDCPSEEIIAYLDGELEAAVVARLDAHFMSCTRCAEELRLQQRLLLELDFALAVEEPAVEMPEDFARVVAMRARSDMRGVRSARERRLAFRLCAALLGLSFLLLGSAALGSVFAPLRVAWKCVTALSGFLGHALYDAGSGLVVLSRGVVGHLLFESRGLRLFALVLLTLGLFTLSHLIKRYHRARIIE